MYYFEINIVRDLLKLDKLVYRGSHQITTELGNFSLRLWVHVYGMSQICPYDFFKKQYSGFPHVQVE